MYDIRDVVNKAIELGVQKKALYESIAIDAGDPRVSASIRVIIKTIDREIRHYENIIANVSDEMAESIDFGTYDKISSLVAQFSRLMIAPKITTRQAFIAYVIELEESVYALLIDIQGRMVVNKVVASSVSYYVLSELIAEKSLFVEQLKNFQKN